MTPDVILLTILMFFLLVGIHEWGHFYFAKRAGILVREFAIGFGPKLFSYTKGETKYTLRLIPFGGYVRMAGEDPEVIQIHSGQTIGIQLEDEQVKTLYLDQLDQRTDIIIGTVEHIDLEKQLTLTLDLDGEHHTFSVHPQAIMIARNKETQIAPLDRQFAGKTVGQRAMTIFAGPMMNIILAFVLFLLLVIIQGVPVENPTYLQIANVHKNSIAEQSGLRSKDIVVSVNGETIGADSEKLVRMIQQSPNQPMTWEILRENVKMQIEVTPESFEGQGRIGVSITPPFRSPSIGEAIQATWSQTINAGDLIIRALKMLVTFQLDWDDLGGPVRMVEFTGEAARLGFTTLLNWTAFLSLYLGIFNLLPFPALDGSRLLFIGLEAVRGKPIDPNRESLVHFIGFAMIMALMLIVTYNDILRLFKGKG